MSAILEVRKLCKDYPQFRLEDVSFLVIGAAETLHHLPGLSALNHGDLRDPLPQTAVLFLGVVLYVLMTWCSYRKSVREFEEIDL